MGRSRREMGRVIRGPSSAAIACSDADDWKLCKLTLDLAALASRNCETLIEGEVGGRARGSLRKDEEGLDVR